MKKIKQPITLFQFPPAMGLPNASAYCMKLETFLKMAEIPYEVKSIRNPGKGPKKKIPFITDEGKAIGDSTLIIEYFKKNYGTDLNKYLSESEKAVSHALSRMIDEHLNWIIFYSRWKDEEGWAFMQKNFFGGLPPILKQIFPPLIRKKLVGKLMAQGLGLHQRDEIYQLAIDDLKALSAYLADKKYFMGDTPSTLDASAFASIANILLDPLQTPMKKEGQKMQNLVDYTQRMMKQYFPSFVKN